MKFLKLSVLVLSISVITGCEQARTVSTSLQSASAQPQSKDDFYLRGYKRGAGPHGMDLFMFTHQGRTITATCEQDGGDGSCSGLISKVGQHLVGSDDNRVYSTKTKSVSDNTNGKLVIFSGSGKPAPEICNGCAIMPKEMCTMWIQSAEVTGK